MPICLYSNSAGYDLFAAESVTVLKWSRVFYGEIKPRSGLALRNGIVAFNGTVDSGYAGFVYVIVFNNSDFDFNIEKGNRIAQII